MKDFCRKKDEDPFCRKRKIALVFMADCKEIVFRKRSMSLNNRGVFLGEPRLDLGEEADFWAGLRDINILDFLNGFKRLKP